MLKRFVPAAAVVALMAGAAQLRRTPAPPASGARLAVPETPPTGLPLPPAEPETAAGRPGPALATPQDVDPPLAEDVAAALLETFDSWKDEPEAGDLAELVRRYGGEEARRRLAGLLRGR